MAPFWILILYLCKTNPAQTLDLSEPLFVSVKPGEDVTLNCSLTAQSGQALWAWYKQTLKHQDPQRVGTVLTGRQATASPPLDKSKFKIIRSGMSLTIPHVTEDDEGMYFCVMMDLKVMRFSYVTFLDVTECPMHFWPVVGMGLGLGISVICNVTLTLWNWKRKNCRGVKSHLVTHAFPEADRLQDQDLHAKDFSHAALYEPKIKRAGTPEDVVSLEFCAVPDRSAEQETRLAELFYCPTCECWSFLPCECRRFLPCEC